MKKTTPIVLAILLLFVSSPVLSNTINSTYIKSTFNDADTPLCGELFRIDQTGQKSATLTGVFDGEAKVSLGSDTSEYNNLTGRKLSKTGTYIGVDLAEGYSLQAGDIVTVFVTTKSSLLQLFSDQGASLIAESSEVHLGKNEFVLDERANNATSLYLYRTEATMTSMNPYVAYISVYRFCPASEPTLTMSIDTVSLHTSPLSETDTKKVQIIGQLLTPGTYNLSLTAVEGLSVTPNSIDVPANGNILQEVEITYTSNRMVENSIAELSIEVDTIVAKVGIKYSYTSIVTGSCGTNLNWTLDVQDSTLVIDGNGEMYDWSDTNVPWGNLRPYIAHVSMIEGLSYIGKRAFSYTKIASIEIPNSVTRIGERAFLNSNISEITIPAEITKISKYAFSNCNRLKTVRFEGNDNIFIGEGTFSNCISLLTIYSNFTIPPTIDTTMFNGCGILNLIDCYVPDESLRLYSKHNIWSAFNLKAMSSEIGTEDNQYSISYIDAADSTLFSETVTLHVPNAPVITGFTFLRWETVAADIESGITIQAIYEADEPSSAPEVYTNLTNPAQKLIKNGNVYILRGDKTYTLQGQEIK